MMNVREMTAREIMTPEVIAVQVDDPIPDAVQLLLDARITGAPVIDRWGNAVGVFTLTDAADFKNQNADSRDDESFYRFDLKRRQAVPFKMQESLKDSLVGDFMTPRVHSVTDTASVNEVTGYILDRGIHRIFVRDTDNKLVGIITSIDLLRVLSELLEKQPITE